MSNRENPELERARVLAAALRAAKSDHPWTEQECGLLANLCTELGVDAPEHAAQVKRGEALVLSYARRSEKGKPPGRG